MAKLWRIEPHDPQRVAWLERAAGVPAVVAQLLLCRGMDDPDAIRQFLDPKLSELRDPELLPGVSSAAKRLADAATAKRRIVVYGDYDADGVTATAILYRCLTMLGANVGYYIPNRIDEGYGLNDEALKRLAQRGAELVVTVDCGICSVAEAKTARELGIELIITDHHAFGAELPDAAQLVHPRLPGSDYPFAGLCGAAVAFKLAWAVCQHAEGAKKVSPAMREFLMQAIGLAALGTVADVVPLIDENRILTTHGLVSLRHRPTPGIVALLRVAKLSDNEALSSEDVAFSLAPRLNAAGRLGQAQLAVELLVTESQKRADELADYIDQLNNSRGSLERSILLAAKKQAKTQFDPLGDPAIVLADHDWHPGVIGIVAGRLAEKYHRPVVLISLDRLDGKPGVGSARSVPGFDLVGALAACSHHLVGYGGHAAAAGLRIEEKCVDAFRAEFFEHAAAEIGADERIAELAIDAETPLSTLTMQAVNQIERLAPFGEGNRRPMLSAEDVRLDGPARRIGEGGRHVSLRLRQHEVRFRAVAFGQGDWADQLTDESLPLSIAFRPVVNEFRGRRTVELHLADWKPMQSAEPAPIPCKATVVEGR